MIPFAPVNASHVCDGFLALVTRQKKSFQTKKQIYLFKNKKEHEMS